MTNQFLGMDANAWLAIAGGLYAGATVLLAFVTNKASVRSAASAMTVADSQNNSSRAGIERQIEIAAEGVASQIKASAEQQERQSVSTSEAAIIQASAASLSHARQALISALRDEVTGFLADAQVSPRAGGEADPHRDGAARTSEGSIRVLHAHIFKVRLLIRPSEAASTTLVTMLEEALQLGLTDDRCAAIVSHTQAMLQKEWDKVMAGD